MEDLTRHTEVACKHCGDPCEDDQVVYDAVSFCCQGCELVYELLHEYGLETFYQVGETPGVSLKKTKSTDWEYLDHDNFSRQIILYKDEQIAKVSFYLPTIHCSACIWLLEKLYRLHPGIASSQVDFSRKEVVITFRHNEIRLSELVSLLHSIGYTPDFQNADTKRKPYRKLWYQIGIAGFCFGNIMLFSLPEYFGAPLFVGEGMEVLFPYLIALLALPVFFYSAQDYFKSSWAAFRQRTINMDVPIAMGIVTLLIYSYWEIFTHSGQGYLDSLAALVFFLLLGRLYQQKTYDHLRFDRDYTSYFPLTAQILTGESTKAVALAELGVGDIIIVKNEEIIPADSILLDGNANIDYSFVTGESDTVNTRKGQLLYAGGKQCGTAIRLRVTKKPSQSYLTKLWNNDAFTQNKEEYFESLANKISRYFTPAIIIIAIAAGGFWWWAGMPENALRAFTSVLIIACPCALALTSPVTLGSAIRILGKVRFYVKNAGVVEAISRADTIIFDKTGTLTQPNASGIIFRGKDLSAVENQMIFTLLSQSIHPLSREISAFINARMDAEITDYKEVDGQGLTAKINGIPVMAGKSDFLDKGPVSEISENGSAVHIAIGEKYLGYFELKQPYRANMVEMIRSLGMDYSTHLLSGDNEKDRAAFETIFGERENLHFNQSPEDKLAYIGRLQAGGHTTVMLGDGLNDAGALKKSDVGIAITDHTSFFSPACDVIMEGSMLAQLKSIFEFSKKSIRVIKTGFFISLIYNIVGITIAVQALLSPVIAAILMPVSSFTVVIWAVGGTRLAAKKAGLKHQNNQQKSWRY